MNRSARLITGMLAARIAAALVVFAGAPSPPAPGPDTAAGTHVVRVYYFFTTQRCASCRKIEALSADAIQTAFGRELASGSLEWAALNLDDPPNQHFREDYQLYTKSVIVVDNVDGRQVRFKNLPKIWELLHDEAAFRQYVQSEVRGYLDTRP